MFAPVTTLTDDVEVIRRLRLFGIETAQDLAQLTCDELVWQFGEEGRRLWERRRKGKVCPGKEEAKLAGEWEIAGFGLDGLSYLVRATFDRVIKELAKQERLIQTVKLVFCFEKGIPVVIELKFSRGAVDGKSVSASLENRLTAFLEEPVKVHWEVCATFRRCAKSLTLFPPKEEERKARLAGALEELKGRRAPKGLMSVVWDERYSRLPERRAHLESLVKVGAPSPLCTPVPLAKKMVGCVAEEWEIEEEWWRENPIKRRYVRLKSGVRLFWDRIGFKWYSQ